MTTTFYGSPALKQELLSKIVELNTSAYGFWIPEGRYDPVEFCSRYGIPEVLWYAASALYRGEDILKFFDTIPVGVDLSTRGWDFLHWVIAGPELETYRLHPVAGSAIANCVSLVWLKALGEPLPDSDVRSALEAATSVAKEFSRKGPVRRWKKEALNEQTRNSAIYEAVMSAAGALQAIIAPRLAGLSVTLAAGASAHDDATKSLGRSPSLVELQDFVRFPFKRMADKLIDLVGETQ